LTGLLALWTASGAGCASSRPQRLDAATLRASQPKTLLLVLEPNDSFSGAPSKIEGPVPPMLGVLPALIVLGTAAATAGHDFVVDNGLEDPSLALGERLAQSLAAEYGLSVHVFNRKSVQPRARPENRTIDEPSPSREDSDGLPPSDLVLEVRTIDWSLEMAKTKWHRTDSVNRNRAGLRYEVVAKFSDARGKRTLAQGSCVDEDPRIVAARNAPSGAEADALLAPVPTYHDMVVLSAHLVVDELARAEDRCERRLRAEVLALGPPPPPPPRAIVKPAAATPTSPAGPSSPPAPAAPVKQQADDE
jgi:hypothetical protein